MPPDRPAARETAGAVLLILFGVGTRLFFLAVFPNLPFWDSLQLIHFGELIRSNGLTAPGWYWAQFNPGLPLILAGLFHASLPHLAVARTATAVLTGLLGLLPFLIWRDVLAFRWRLLAGALLALWPGQIFFSGVVVQDNWVLPPAVALACLAVRRLRSPGGTGWPIAAGLLFSTCFAIRQEMLVALAPLALAAGISRKGSGRRTRDGATLFALLGMAILLLCLQRREATGRLGFTTEHGALGLFGSFMPGAGSVGWVDGRAYAAAREPSLRQGLFGSPRQLLRLTREEIERRPVFHAFRVASWLPRLALDADSDALLWSVGPRAVAPGIRDRAHAFRRWAGPSLIVELALVQGAFAASLLVGIRRRRPDILVLAGAVALKFAIHMLVSPLGRLVVPAIALELLAIALGLEALEALPSSERPWPLGLAAATSAGLLVLTPLLAGLVARLDAPELPGIRSFLLDAGEGCAVRGEVYDAVVIGLSPSSVTAASVAPRRTATLDFLLPVMPDGAAMTVTVEGTPSSVEADGRRLRSEPDNASAYPIPNPTALSTVSIELPADTIAIVHFTVMPRPGVAATASPEGLSAAILR